jgi:hypothetical protein
MNKFILFALFLSSIIIVIVAEILVNEYLRPPYAMDGAANVFQTQATTQQPAGQNAAATASEASLSASILQQAGVPGAELQTAAFSGKLFGRIDLTNLGAVKAVESHLTKNQAARLASFYEFSPGSEQAAKEFYELLKQRCQTEIGVIINETNGFGQSSFYVNYYEFPEKVFLVFRKGTRVFGFNYNKDLHEAVTKLIGLL